VEGEKDADALNKRGLVATTVPMGAGKWMDDYNSYFAGADVIIVPDNDEPGKEHAVHVTDKVKSIAKSIRILLLPGLKRKEDVSDWLDEGGTKDELLELAFDTDIVANRNEALEAIGKEIPDDSDSARHQNNHFFEENHNIYSTGEDERLVADFAIDINSIVKDDRKGRIFYINIRELYRGNLRMSDTIEVFPESLDDVRSFYKAIRPYTMGEIIQARHDKVRPLSIFKWLLSNFDRPIVRRPDHVGYIQPTDFDKRPYWLFGNALICPPHDDKEGRIILPNNSDEYIVDETTGFTLPLYQSEKEKEQLAPIINTDTKGADAFMGAVREKLIELIGGGDKTGRAKNFAKIMFSYVIYHLYEKELYYANDMNGHTVMMYVYGPKGTGKTTYFNTFLRAFFGLHKTKEMKGNTVTIPAIENQMGHFSQLPVCYDEYNPEHANIDYQHINGYYHKTSRSVADVDRAGRNKFTPIRSTLSLTSNFRINLDVDQADATESRVIYFEYKKEYRSENSELFEWFEENLDNLSRITSYLLLNQTDESRKSIKMEVRKLYNLYREKLDAKVKENPKKYVAEHRLTDNYCRLLGCYEHIFGRDNEFRKFIFQEILERFASAKTNQKENSILNQIIYLSSFGRIMESWHYHYNSNQEELYVNLSQMYEAYAEYKRDKAVSHNQFKEILKDYFEECGGYEVKTKRWYGTYYNREKEKVDVDKPMHSYILTYKQVAGDNLLREMFPANEEQTVFIRKYEKKSDGENNSEFSDPGTFVMDDEAPF
jgi:GTPase SAR1 family protein